MVLMLIGNKSDLARDRAVKTELAAEYAEKETMALLETSALDSSNVSTAFECIIKGKRLRLTGRNLQTTGLEPGEEGGSPEPASPIRLASAAGPQIRRKEGGATGTEKEKLLLIFNKVKPSNCPSQSSAPAESAECPPRICAPQSAVTKQPPVDPQF